MGKGFEIHTVVPNTATPKEMDFAVLEHLRLIIRQLGPDSYIREVLNDAGEHGAQNLRLGVRSSMREKYENEARSLRQENARLERRDDQMKSTLEQFRVDNRGLCIALSASLQKLDRLTDDLNDLQAELARVSAKTNKPLAPSCDLETALDRWRKVSERLSAVKAERDGYKVARDVLLAENKALRHKLDEVKKLLSE